MTVLEQDLKTIKVVIMQHRGGYHITTNDIKDFKQALERIANEVKEVVK